MSGSPVVVRQLDVPVRGPDAAWPGVRLAHISDCHFRRWNRVFAAAQQLLLPLEYDLLAFTGDIGTFIPFWKGAARLARRFFEPLAIHRPIVGVLGNHDSPQLAAHADLPIRFLRDERITWIHDGVTFELAGIEQSRSATDGRLDLALRGGRTAAFTVLLAHYPSTIFRLPAGRVDLVLAGHTHGGQIRVPRLGCIWPHDRIPRAFAAGLNRVGDTYLHVNPGLGASLPFPVRVNCPAEITIIRIKPIGPDRSEPQRDPGRAQASVRTDLVATRDAGQQP